MASPVAIFSLENGERYEYQPSAPLPGGRFFPAQGQGGPPLLWQPLPIDWAQQGELMARLLTLPQLEGLPTELFWQPVAVTAPPELGLLYPPLPEGFFFSGAEPLTGQPRIGKLFLGGAGERGAWLQRLSMGRELCQAVAVLQRLGILHPGLADHLLLDPIAGHCRVGGLELALLPGLPEGSLRRPPRYTAPHVSGSSSLFSTLTEDRYTLSVLLFDLLLPEQRQHTSVVEMATVAGEMFGGAVGSLFAKAWGEGSENPLLRPGPEQWVAVLTAAERLLIPCPACGSWLLHKEAAPLCPHCGQPAPAGLLYLHSPLREPGQWLADQRILALSPERPLRTGGLNAAGDNGQGDVLASCIQIENSWYLADVALPAVQPLGGGSPQPLYRIDETLALQVEAEGKVWLLTGNGPQPKQV